MSASYLHPAPSDRQGTVSESKAVSRSPTNFRIPLERVLPESVATQLERAAAASNESVSALTTKLDRKFNITRRYGITRRRLLYYLKRLRATDDATHPAPVKCAPTPADRDPGPQRSMPGLRRRQESVAKILEETFGKPAKCSPELWDRRAYLMIVGLVYERLATNEQEISTDELIALAKVLAANRRVDARVSETKHDAQDSTPHPADGKLPENFADIVRQVYGTNFHGPGDGGEA